MVMLAKIIGWVWVIIGILFLIKPNFLKAKLQKKGIKKIKKLLFGIAIVFGIFLIAASGKIQGFVSIIIMILGIIAIIKGVILLKAKFAEELLDWVSRQPILFFRIIALVYITIGVVILLGVG